MAYYIGVDGGGTKTAYALFDENKSILAETRSPGSNHENLEGAFDEAAAIIWGGISELLDRAGVGLSEVDFTLMGLAGIDHPYQHDMMCAKLDALGLKNYAVFNDGFIVVKAGSVSGAAVGYNCGTGTCCNSIDSDGRMLQLAGLGAFSGDMGNGHWIAETVFRKVYDEVFLGINPTDMTARLFAKEGFGDRDEFADSLSRLEAEDADSYIMTLIDVFFESLNSGDAQAYAVAVDMAERGARLIAAHIRQRRFDSDPVEIVLSGSINVKLPNDIYIDLLTERSEEYSGRRLSFVKLDRPPVTGCVNWILQEFAGQ